jgi:hypothetical protein
MPSADNCSCLYVTALRNGKAPARDDHRAKAGLGFARELLLCPCTERSISMRARSQIRKKRTSALFSEAEVLSHWAWDRVPPLSESDVARFGKRSVNAPVASRKAAIALRCFVTITPECGKFRHPSTSSHPTTSAVASPTLVNSTFEIHVAARSQDLHRCFWVGHGHQKVLSKRRPALDAGRKRHQVEYEPPNAGGKPFVVRAYSN